MKGNKGSMVLSGSMYAIPWNDSMHRTVKTILEFTNVLDITKAWRVRDITCWLKSDVAEMNLPSDALVNLNFQLNTDDMNAEAFWAAGDNRAIAFGEVAYACSENYYKGAGFAGAPAQNINAEWHIKPEHIIQTRLDLAVSGQGSGATTEGLFFDINYIVYLEEVTITPTESIVYNIKSKAQDLST